MEFPASGMRIPTAPEVMIVHNGIIENYEALKIGLVSHGYAFESDTDILKQLHLLHCKSGREIIDSIVDSVISQLDGAFALAIVDEQTPGLYGRLDKVAHW